MIIIFTFPACKIWKNTGIVKMFGKNYETIWLPDRWPMEELHIVQKVFQLYFFVPHSLNKHPK